MPFKHTILARAALKLHADSYKSILTASQASLQYGGIGIEQYRVAAVQGLQAHESNSHASSVSWQQVLTMVAAASNLVC